MTVTYIESIAGGVVTSPQIQANTPLAVLNQGSIEFQLWNFTADGYFVLQGSDIEYCMSIEECSLQNGSAATLQPKGAAGYLQTWGYDITTNNIFLLTQTSYLLTSGSGGSQGPVVYVSTEQSGLLTQWLQSYIWEQAQQFDFSNGIDVDRTVWQSPQWISANDNPSFFGQTSIRNPADFGIPCGCVPIVNNAAQLYLSTFNPVAAIQNNPDFLGAQISTINKWGLQSFDAVAFEAQVVMPINGSGAAPGGVVASLFAYNLIEQSPTFLHDEIDFEISSNYWANQQPEVNTNVYVVTDGSMSNYDEVVTSQVGLSGTVTLRIEWSQQGVSWYINKSENPVPFYSEANVPQTDMSLVLNFWVPDSGWNWAYNSSLSPTGVGPGQQWIYQVNWAKVWVVSKS